MAELGKISNSKINDWTTFIPVKTIYNFNALLQFLPEKHLPTPMARVWLDWIST